MRRRWCDVCRGEALEEGDLRKCSSCPRRFHIECVQGLKEAGADAKWECPTCEQAQEGDGLDIEDKAQIKAAKEALKITRAAHTALKGRSCQFFQREAKRLAPFVPPERLKVLQTANKAGKKAAESYEPVKKIGPSEEYIHATIRPYQQEGVNWLLKQYDTGIGGILADEMGLGKTLQTLSFLSALKAAGLQGPHLVVTPLAVLQNWHNEIKKFTPGLSVIKVHGSRSERDRILSMPVVLAGGFDVYLTTYETVLSEEPFFTESFLFHTLTIDEGHRLKNESGQLAASLARVTVPFRLLLTGTPLQNNLNELWALMQFILPNALEGCKETFDAACSLEEGQLDRAVVDQARSLLESLMIRRVKSEVETTLLPKIHWVLKVPMPTLQRQWYRRFVSKDSEVRALVTRKQLVAKIQQLQKVINHPKVILLALDRERDAARSLQRRAEGSEFVAKPQVLEVPPEAAQVMEAELRNLRGTALVQSSGKLQLLDRLLSRVRAEGSRILLFSQFTLTLDVLSEYCAHRFGPEGRGFLRLDGSTNRIKREMDVRAFNAPNSRIPIYLISTRAGGQGINLATADVVVLYDTCWNPQVDLQAQDRAHRIGQKKQVKVFRLIAEATLEERVLTRARQKLVLDALVIKKKEEVDQLANEVGDEADQNENEEEAMEKLSLDELWSFLSFGAGAEGEVQSFDEAVAPLTTPDMDRIIDQGRAKDNQASEEAAAWAASAEGEAAAAAEASKADDLYLEASSESDDEAGVDGSAKKKRKFPKPRGRPPVDMKWNSREGVWVPRTGAQGDGPEDDPNSINNVSEKKIEKAIGKGLLMTRLVKARDAEPFCSREDCAARIPGLGEVKLKALDAAGITFPEIMQGGDEKKRKVAVANGVDLGHFGGAAAAATASLPITAPKEGDTKENAAMSAMGAMGGRGGRAVKAVKRYEPPTMHHNTGKRRKLKHEDECFSCKDGGELLECSVCPKVYHATTECAGLVDDKLPKGSWHCPWHECWECDRKSSQSGGMLFHCTQCPMAYCFDCAPDKYTTQRTGTTNHKYIAASLENRGCVSTKSYLFFTCDECDPARVEAEKRAEAMQEIAEKRAEEERQRIIAWNRPENVAARAAAAAEEQQRQMVRMIEYNKPENRAKREASVRRKAVKEEKVHKKNISGAWEQHLDATRGLMYWWNKITHESSWQNPNQSVEEAQWQRQQQHQEQQQAEARQRQVAAQQAAARAASQQPAAMSKASSEVMDLTGDDSDETAAATGGGGLPSAVPANDGAFSAVVPVKLQPTQYANPTVQKAAAAAAAAGAGPIPNALLSSGHHPKPRGPIPQSKMWDFAAGQWVDVDVARRIIEQPAAVGMKRAAAEGAGNGSAEQQRKKVAKSAPGGRASAAKAKAAAALAAALSSR